MKISKDSKCPGLGGGCTPYIGLYGEAPPERGTFFRLQVYERVGISLAKVYERVGKSVKEPTGLTDECYGFIKSRKRSICVIDSFLEDSSFAPVKRDTRLLTRYMEGVPFVNRRYTKGVTFS